MVRTSNFGEGRRRERRNHPVEDRESLGSLDPLPRAEHEHSDKRDRGIAKCGKRDVPRRNPLASEPEDELEPQKAEQTDRRRPASKPLGIGGQRRAALAADQLKPRLEEPAEGPPRVERTEDVAKHQAQRDQAEPGGDEDEAGGEVLRRYLCPP